MWKTAIAIVRTCLFCMGNTDDQFMIEYADKKEGPWTQVATHYQRAGLITVNK